MSGDQGGITSVSTRPEAEPFERLRRRRAARRVGISVIGLGVLLGLGNIVGVRTGVARDEAEGVMLAVTYA
ncbi:MAG TPA: hypothetical protein VNC60_06055, partial [Actinomycetota bacterium]|nr:hypothetical protein [Actinomycetota bacterium]